MRAAAAASLPPPAVSVLGEDRGMCPPPAAGSGGQGADSVVVLKRMKLQETADTWRPLLVSTETQDTRGGGGDVLSQKYVDKDKFTESVYNTSL